MVEPRPRVVVVVRDLTPAASPPLLPATEPGEVDPAADPAPAVKASEPVDSVESPPRFDRRWVLAVAAVWFLLSIALVHVGTVRIERFGFGSPDDAMALQVLWNTSQGEPLRYTIESWQPPFVANYWGSHIDLTYMLLLAPFYAVLPSYTALLALRIPLFLAGVFPLFFLARRRLGCPRRAAAVAGLFLFFPLLLANTIRFGPVYWLVPTLVLLAIERLDAGHRRAAAGWLLVAALTREEVPLFLAAFLIPLALIEREHRRLWLGLAGGCLAWTVLYLGVLKPHVFGEPVSHFLGRYSHLGSSIPAVLVSPLTRPGAFFGHLFSSEARWLALLLLLPWGPAVALAPRFLLPAAVPLAMVAISNKPSDKVLGHYLMPCVPFLAVATVYGLERLAGWKDRLRVDLSLAALALGVVLTTLIWVEPVGPLKRYEPVRVLSPFKLQLLERMVPNHARLRAALAEIPPDASVSSYPHLMMLLANRRDLHPFPIRAEHADFLVIDTFPLAPRWPHTTPTENQRAIHRALAEPRIRVQRMGDFLIVDRRAVSRAAATD